MYIYVHVYQFDTTNVIDARGIPKFATYTSEIDKTTSTYVRYFFFYFNKLIALSRHKHPAFLETILFFKNIMADFLRFLLIANLL